MAHKGMKKLRQVEKAGLIVLCIVMLGTLGIGTTTVFKGCGQDLTRGSFVIDGEEFTVDLPELREYHPMMTFLRVFGQIPPWKFANARFDPEFQAYQPDNRDLWTFIVLDKLAGKTGLTVPPQTVQDWIRSVFRDPETQLYSKEIYSGWLGRQGVAEIWPTASEFEKFLRRYLTVDYLVRVYGPLLMPTSEQVYEQWSVRNRRHDIEYAVQTVSSLRREVDPAAIPMPEVEAYYGRDLVRRHFRVPTRREFEALYIKTADVTDEQYAELEKKAEERDLVNLGPQEAFRYWYANEKRLYRTDDLVDRLKKEWEQRRDAGEKKDAEKTDGDGNKPADADKPADGDEPADADKPADGDEPADADKPADEDKPAPDLDLPAVPGADEFKDPTAGMSPEEKFKEYFQARVEKDLFLRKLLERLLMDERLKKQGLKSLAEEWSLPYFVTERGLDRTEIYKNEPVGGQQLREALNRMGEADAGKYAESIVEIGDLSEPTGFAMFRVIRVAKEHYPELGAAVEEEILRSSLPLIALVDREQIEEGTLAQALQSAFPDAEVPDQETFKVEEVVRLMLRQAKAEEEATARLEKVMEAVKAGGQTFRSAAEEKGFRVFELNRITSETPMAEPVEPGPEAKPTPEEEKQFRLDRQRWFLLKGRSFGSRLPLNIRLINDTKAPGFVPQVLIDRETDAAYVVHVKAHVMPGPEEMPELEAGRIRMELLNHNRRTTLRSFFEFDRIVDRYSLFVDGLTNEAEKKREAAEKKAAEEAAKKGGGEGQ